MTNPFNAIHTLTQNFTPKTKHDYMRVIGSFLRFLWRTDSRILRGRPLKKTIKECPLTKIETVKLCNELAKSCFSNNRFVWL